MWGFRKKSPEQSPVIDKETLLASKKADRENIRMMMGQNSHPDDAARLEALDKEIAELEGH